MSLIYPQQIKTIEKLLQDFLPFAKERMGYPQTPDIRLAKDTDNAKNPLGKTGYYEPDHQRITVYVDGRHPKDIMRSISHELVHHAQNIRGDLEGTVGEQGYAQNDEHLREMEREAYEQGNLCFRDWEDGLKMSNMGLHEEMQASRDDLIDMIRDYSKELTGRRAEYGDLEKLANMSDEELDMYYQGMFDSPEAQFMADKFRDDEEAEMGTDDDFDRMPKQSGMGRGMRESLNLFERVSRSFGYKLNESDDELSNQLKQTVAHLQNKYNLSQEEALEAMAKMLSAMEKHDTERRVSDYTAQSKFREGRGSDFFDSDEEKEMMKKMSKKDFYNYVTRDRGKRKMSDDEVNAIESFNRWLNDKEADDYHIRQMTWEPAQSYRGGRVLAYNRKEGYHLDVMNDTPVSDKEMEDILPEAASEVERASDKMDRSGLNDILSSIKGDDVKMGQFLAKIAGTLGLDHEEFSKLYSQRVKGALAKQNKGDLKEMANKEIKKEYMDDFDMDPHEDEEINALLAKYGLDDEGAPADADAEAAAERDSMGEFDAEEEDEEPIMMKEKEPEQMELDMDTSAPAGMTSEKFADMFDLRPQEDDDGQIVFYASSEMGPKLTELIRHARDAGYDMKQGSDGSITIYTDEYPSHGEEPVRGFGITMEEKSDEDGDGDIDSDDYMAKKDKAIKKAMGKEEDDKKEESFDPFHSDRRNSRLNEALMKWCTK